MTEWDGMDRRKEHNCHYGDMIKEMHDALLGTLDKKGMKTVLQEHDTFINGLKKSAFGFWSAVILGFITLTVKWVWDRIAR